MRLAFAGGGSGGHVYPALAVAREAVARGMPASEVVFIVSPDGLERRVVEGHGFAHECVSAARLAGGRWLQAGLENLAGILDARRALARARPDVLLATGGYVAAPAVLAAWSLSVPSVLLEPNTVPGRANRLLSRLSGGVLTSFPQTRRHLAARVPVVEVGTPLRFSFDPARVRRGPGRTLLVVGGSQGARALNLAVRRLYPDLSRVPGLSVVHVTGTRDHGDVSAGWAAGQGPIEVIEYTERMDELYYRADFALCRAGAVTISELVEFGVPAIFVPHEPSVGDHQYQNARVLAEAGAAAVVRQGSLSDASLLGLIRGFAANGMLDRRREALASLRRPGAAGRVLDALHRLVRTGRLADG